MHRAQIYFHKPSNIVTYRSRVCTRIEARPSEYRFFEALRAPALLFGINMPNQGMFMWRVEEPRGAVRSEARELFVKKLPFPLLRTCREA